MPKHSFLATKGGLWWSSSSKLVENLNRAPKLEMIPSSKIYWASSELSRCLCTRCWNQIFWLVVPRDMIHNHYPGLERWNQWLLLSSRDLGSIFLIMVVSSIIQHFFFLTMVNINDVKPTCILQPRLGSKFSGQSMKIFILKMWLTWDSSFAFRRHDCITYCHNLLQVHA